MFDINIYPFMIGAFCFWKYFWDLVGGIRGSGGTPTPFRIRQAVSMRFVYFSNYSQNINFAKT